MEPSSGRSILRLAETYQRTALLMRSQQVIGHHVNITIRHHQGRVPEQALQGERITTVPQEMQGEGVAEQMRMYVANARRCCDPLRQREE